MDVIVGIKAGKVTLNLTVRMGDLSATVPLEITVKPISLADAVVTLSQNSYTYTGEELKPEVTVTLDGETLTAEDYDIEYQDNVGTEGTESVATVVVKGKGNYTGTASTTFRITTCQHEYKEEVVKEATCTEAGEKKLTCSKCGAEKTEEIKALGHTEVIDEKVEPTCTESGLTEGKHCSVCNEVLAAQEVIPATGHSWDEGTVTKKATCTEAGEKKLTCSKCGAEKTEEIKALGHTEVIDEKVEPTCTESGLTEGKHCSVCNEVLAAQEVIPAAGHKAVSVEAKEPTCTEAGHSAGSKCSVCGVMLESSETSPALGHSYDAGKVTKASTCTEEGVRTFTCTRCEESYTESIEKTAHTEETIAGQAATCTESGLTDGTKCSVCGRILKEQSVIPATGHTEEVVSGKAPTCTESGLTDGKKCSVCGEITVSQTTIPAAGHSYGEWVVTKEATWEEDGVKERTCIVCNKKETQTINKGSYGHDDEFTVEGEVTKEPTCVETGTQIMKCSNPNCNHTTTVTIPALGHEFGDPVIVEATCTGDGTSTKTCSRCGEEEVTKLPAKGHQYSWEVTKEATKKEPGIETGTCTVCKDVVTRELAYQDIVYKIIYGADSVWERGTDGSLKIGADGDYSKFESVLVDGQSVDPKNYKAESGSTYITFEKEYLDTLADGKHICRIVYGDGYAETTFSLTRAEGEKNPTSSNTTDTKKPTSGEKNQGNKTDVVNTGDTAPILPLVVGMLLSMGAIIAVLKKRHA